MILFSSSLHPNLFAVANERTGSLDFEIEITSIHVFHLRDVFLADTMGHVPSGIMTVYSIFSLNLVKGVESLYLWSKRPVLEEYSSISLLSAIFLFFRLPCPDGSNKSRQKSCN